MTIEITIEKEAPFLNAGKFWVARNYWTGEIIDFAKLKKDLRLPENYIEI